MSFSSNDPKADLKKKAAEFLRAAKFEGKMRSRERKVGSIGRTHCRFMARAPLNVRELAQIPDWTNLSTKAPAMGSGPRAASLAWRRFGLPGPQ